MTDAATLLVGAGFAHGAHVAVGALPVVAVLALWSALVAEERRDPTDAKVRVMSPPVHTPPRPRPEPDPGREGWAVLLVAIAVLDVASAVIHGAVTGEHFDESGLFGAFFLVVAAAQLAAAVWLVARRSRTATVAIGAMNLGLVIIWVISRTVGVPVGPEPGVAEAIGAVRRALHRVRGPHRRCRGHSARPRPEPGTPCAARHPQPSPAAHGVGRRCPDRQRPTPRPMTVIHTMKEQSP